MPGSYARWNSIGKVLASTFETFPYTSRIVKFPRGNLKCKPQKIERERARMRTEEHGSTAPKPNEYLKAAPPNTPPRILARLAVVDETSRRNLDAIQKRTRAQDWDNFRLRTNTLLALRVPMNQKIYAYWAIVDDAMRATQGNVACKRGCSSCCHIAVGIMEPEAKAIGARIGRMPAAVPGRDGFKGFDWGLHNPCTFLGANGECSIYENRPLACRTHYSLDDDAMLCDVRDVQPWPVPYMSHLQWEVGMLMLMGVDPDNPKTAPKLGDIREFFPKVE